MPENRDVTIDLVFYEPEVLPETLERVVSSMAALANLSVDRLMNALTVVDALTPGVVAEMDSNTARHVEVKATDGRLDVAIDRLKAGEAAEILSATAMPGIENLLDELAAEVRVEDEGAFSRLVVSLD